MSGEMTIERLYAEFLQSAGICTDTRKAVAGTIFFAIRGDRFDGNAFVEEALGKGCRLAVTDRSDLAGRDGVALVRSSLDMLQQLARHHRRVKAPDLLAVTGSNGKTTTKELIAAILSKKFRVLSTSGNLNNHIGVPLTLLGLRDEQMAVIEMGANHAGEIRKLAEIAEPGTGLITNVGKAHLEGFGSLEGVLRAKGELYEFLAGTGGMAFVDGSDPLLMKKSEETGVKRMVVGPRGDLPVVCRIVKQDPFLEMEVETGRGEPFRVETNLVGGYNLQNILYAVALGIHFGISPALIREAVAGYRPQNLRSQLIGEGRNRILLDAYNANPTSMREAIGGLLQFAPHPRMLVLGDMAEMGDASEQEHRELVKWIGTLPVDLTLLVGKIFSGVCGPTPGVRDPSSGVDHSSTSVDPSSGVHGPSGSGFDPSSRVDPSSEIDPSTPVIVFGDTGEVERWLRSERPRGYHVLVKGSRIMGLEKLIPLLTG
ncbi:MAG TPA: UDP-N-acetylmuramoyl-tripeptide--D-alanyl-D-alanine ligase [Bacteroides sp.]|nr:UDP-N-acetylmuramoyl-tripeptide--D-alanyl-D-alanine ligase [Bacteroides sp.]